MSDTATPDAPEAPPSPSPADLAKNGAPPPDAPEVSKDRTPDDYESEIQKLRRENANWRTKYREAEPIVKQHHEREEAAKTEVQKAIERAEAAEKRDQERDQAFTRLELAMQHNISPDDIDLLGSGSREEMEARALRVAALSNNKPSPPPSDRPVEGLRPGATPEPPKPADDSYPAAWKPNHMRDNESRSQYGQ